MKSVLSILLCFGLGLALSRIGSDREPARPETAQVPPKTTKPGPAPSKPATPSAAYSLEGDWRPAVKSWAGKDPVAFYNWLVECGVPPGEEVLQVFFEEWVRQDADAAFTAAFNLPVDFKRNEQVLDRMLAQVLNQPGGLETALKWIPSVLEQISGWTHPQKEWLKSGPPEKIAALLKARAEGGGYAGTLISLFAGHWATQDHDAAMAWMNSLGPEQRGHAFRGLMESLAKSQPQAALEYLASGEATSEDRFQAYMPLAELAKTDPKAALDWWETHIGVDNYNSLRSVYGIWVKESPDAALGYALAIEDPIFRRQSLSAWSESAGGAEVFKAVEQQPRGADRRALLDSLSSNYQLDSSDQTALRRLVEDPADPDISPTLASRIGATYARSDPQAALEWAAALPESRRLQSLKAVLSTWPDKVAAARAVENFPPGPRREAVLEAAKANAAPR